MGVETSGSRKSVSRRRGDEPMLGRPPVFPAGAGMNRLNWKAQQEFACVSRRRGDEPLLLCGLLGRALCFPQARG